MTDQSYRDRAGKLRHSRWSAALSDKCKALYIDRGETAEHTARQLGPEFTRNMVIGFALRRGWSRSGEIARQNIDRATRAPRQPPPKPAPVEIATGHVRTPPDLPPRAIPRSGAFALTPGAIPLVGRPFGSCAWPLGDPVSPADQLCCGEKTGGPTYCPAHARMRAAKFAYGLFAGGADELIAKLRKVS